MRDIVNKQKISTGKSNRITTKLSRIHFPETCPVCSDDAEDIVFITVVEPHGLDSYESNLFIRADDKATATLEAAKGATTFAVPTCIRHGSGSVRGFRTKLVAAIGFFVFFYPILFFLLQINVALIYSRPLMEPVMWLIVFTSALTILIGYGVFPRALERFIKFEDVNRMKDSVTVIIKNQNYIEKFLQLNEIFAELEKRQPSDGE